MRRLAISIIACMALSLSACQQMDDTSHADRSPAHEVKFWHMVIVQLKDPGDAEAQRRIIEASKTFQKIPGVERVYVGRAVPGTRPERIPNFDIGVMVGFRSKDDMAAYVADPIHKEAATKVLAPLAKEFSFYDFSNE